MRRLSAVAFESCSRAVDRRRFVSNPDALDSTRPGTGRRHRQATGHRAQLIEFRDMLVTVRDKVAALKSQGKSLADIIAAKPTAAFDDKWGGFVIDSKFFTQLVYEGL
ncbi:MAG: hypothetical protein ABWY00_01265 [Dongiaceae bacterium]